MIEPTAQGFLRELGTAVGANLDEADAGARQLAQFGNRVVLLLHSYELFRLLDSWFRRTFVPPLPDNVRIVIAEREAACKCVAYHSWVAWTVPHPITRAPGREQTPSHCFGGRG